MLMLSLYCKVKALYATRDRGATAAEYALLVFAIIAVVATTIGVFGTRVSDLFTTACTSIGGTGC